MKCLIKVFCVVSVFILITGLFGCANKLDDKANYEFSLTEVEYEPLSAGELGAKSSIVGAIRGRTNDLLLYKNPDRGFRTTVPLVIQPEHPDPEDPSKTSDTCDLIFFHCFRKNSCRSKV